MDNRVEVNQENVVQYAAESAASKVGANLTEEVIDTNIPIDEKLPFANSSVNIPKYPFDDVLKRSMLIAYGDISAGTIPSGYVSINIISFLLANPVMKAKLVNATILRATFKVTLEVLVSPFAYGLVLIAYKAGTTDGIENANYAFNLNHSILDVSSNTTASIVVPYLHPLPYISLGVTNSNSSPLQNVVVAIPQPLVNAVTGDLIAGTYNVYVAIEDIELAGALHSGSGTLYTSDTIFTPGNYPHEADIAMYPLMERAKMLTIDENYLEKAVTRDKLLPLSLENTIKRHGISFTRTISTSDAQFANVGFLPVSPTLGISTTEGIQMSPFGYFSALYASYRGSIKVRILIPSSRFIRGKLRVYYKPGFAPTVSDAYETISAGAYSKIFDLSSTVDAEFDCTYQDYRGLIPMYQPHGYRVGNGYDLGQLGFVIDQPIRGGEGAALTLTVYVSYIAGDDFQYGLPSSYVTARARSGIQETTNTPALPATLTPYITPVEDANGQYASYTSETTLFGSVAKTSDSQREVSIMHRDKTFQDENTSLEALMKRYSLATIFPSSHGTFPTPDWKVALYEVDNISTAMRASNAPGAQLVQYASNLEYICRAFSGYRGSVYHYYSITMPGDIRLTVSRGTRPQSVAPRWYVSNDTAASLNLALGAPNFGGKALFRKGEPILVKVPYQSRNQYMPMGNTNFGPMLRIDRANVEHEVFADIQHFQAAGDDFELMFWNGPPPQVNYTGVEWS